MKIKPYGDTLNDGIVQLSFTLPIEFSEKAKEAARSFVREHDFQSCEIVHSEILAPGFTYFIVYAKSEKDIDLDKIKIAESSKQDSINFEEINAFIKNQLGRKIIAVGACTGFDAHTVSIDAIMNMKGYNHHFGLERYEMFETYNLGAQVPNAEFIEFCLKVKADAMLISQVVTQKDVHVKNMKDFIEILKKRNLSHNFIKVVGGPRINNELAVGLGFDAGFGKGTYPEQVATFILKELYKRGVKNEK